MRTAPLKAVVGRYPHTALLFDGPQILASGVNVEVDRSVPGVTARRMIRELAYDICELPIVNYFSAREHGVEIDAIPVILTRRFPHATLICNRSAGISTPKDLEGTRIGISYYGNTDTVWAQGILAQQFGVDLDHVTFVTSQQEQVPGVRLPANVLNLAPPPSSTDTDALPSSGLTDMLIRGELSAIIYGQAPKEMPRPGLAPLFDDLATAEKEWYDATGIFPALHTVVFRCALLEQVPELPRDLLSMFEEAKRNAFEQLNVTRRVNDADLPGATMSGFPAALPVPADHSYLGADPIPYGLAANRDNLATLLRIAVDRGALSSAPKPEELFRESPLP